MSASEIAEWAFSGGVLALIGWTCVQFLIDAERRERLHLVARRRAPRARRAAVEASLEDPVFAPERVEAAVKQILALGGGLWQGSETAGLRQRWDVALIRAWARAKAASVGAARVVGEPKVDILRVVDREGETEDRVVARVRFRVDRGPSVPLAARRVRLDERWTLSRRGEEWFLSSVTGDPLSTPVLTAPLIPSPSDDTERLREASLQELTSHSRQSDPHPGDLVDTDAPPQLQLSDLAVADDRFSPLLIAAALTHAVEAWEEACDGSDAPLLAIATKAAVRSLLHPPDDHGRRYIRDATLRRWHALRVDASADPPSILLSVSLNAAIYTEHGSYVSGDDRQLRDLNLAWTLELNETADHKPLWRLTNSAEL